MNSSNWIARGVIALGISTAPFLAHGQDSSAGRWSLGVTGGTLGVGPELAFRASPYLGARANAGFLTISRDEEVDDISYDGDLNLNSFGVMLDWYPTGDGLRISVGARANNNEVELVGAPTTNVTIGGTTYSPAQVGTLVGTVTTDDFAPALTIGYGGTLAKGFTLGAEIGVLWQGKPTIDNLRATGPLAGTNQFQADIEREQQRIEDEVSDYDLWPILQLAFLYRF
ncbi:hypothetical protein [Peristeroidobacter agariperforans]|uniref:hypothetical protein n=1 Tax=Peristeroidobacter agariperforans TaxID=268404 RepID=UPI00101CB6A7|nr:hypothetical protein [Peristeroidobacter agariperforans]